MFLLCFIHVHERDFRFFTDSMVDPSKNTFIVATILVSRTVRYAAYSHNGIEIHNNINI